MEKDSGHYMAVQSLVFLRRIRKVYFHTEVVILNAVCGLPFSSRLTTLSIRLSQISLLFDII
jgi:hypothetical protein